MSTRTRNPQSTRTTQARTGAAQALVLDPSTFDSLGDQGQRSAGVERSEFRGERSEPVSEWSETLADRCAPSPGIPRHGDPRGGLSDAVVDQAVDRARVRGRVELPDASALSDEVIDELLAGARTGQEIAGPGGLLAALTKRLVESALEVELADHLGYEPHLEPAGGAGNTRNGSTPKTLITDQHPRQRLRRRD